MRITFIIPHKRQETTEIDENASGEDVKNMLVSRFGFPEGKYTYIFMGVFLPEEETFKSINREYAKVVIYVKSPEEIAKEKKIEEEKRKSIEAANERIEQFINESQLDTLYSEPDMWHKLDECAEMSHLLRNQQNMFRFVTHDMKHTVCPGRDPNTLLAIMLSILDSPLIDHIGVLSEFEAELEELPLKLRDVCNQLFECAARKDANFDKEKVFEVAKQNEFKYEESVNKLVELGIIKKE